MRQVITAIVYHLAVDEINGFSSTLGLYQELAKTYDVRLLIPRIYDIYPDQAVAYGANITIRSIATDYRRKDIKDIDDLSIIEMICTNQTFQRRLRKEAEDSALIICEGWYYVALAKKTFPEKRIIFRSLHVEYDQEKWMSQYSAIRHSWAYAEKIFEMEELACKNADQILALTPHDKDRLCELYEIGRDRFEILPNCFPNAYLADSYVPRERGKSNALYLGHCPIDSVDRFVAMTKRFPDIKFHIVGRAGYDLTDYGSNVIIHGIVSEDKKRRILEDCDFAFNLTHMAVGMNSKILDYFSMGIPVLSSMQGMRGFDVQPGRDFFPADYDTIEQDIAAFLDLSDRERRQIALNAFYHLCRAFNYANFMDIFSRQISGNTGNSPISDGYESCSSQEVFE